MLSGRLRTHLWRSSPDHSCTPMMPKMKKTKKQRSRTLPSIGSVSSNSITRIRIPGVVKNGVRLELQICQEKTRSFEWFHDITFTEKHVHMQTKRFTDKWFIDKMFTDNKVHRRKKLTKVGDKYCISYMVKITNTYEINRLHLTVSQIIRKMQKIWQKNNDKHLLILASKQNSVRKPESPKHNDQILTFWWKQLWYEIPLFRTSSSSWVLCLTAGPWPPNPPPFSILGSPLHTRMGSFLQIINHSQPRSTSLSLSSHSSL